MDDKAMFSEVQAIGPYRIVRCIGRGGMGEVYEVEHESLGVHYALKTFAYRGSAHRALCALACGRYFALTSLRQWRTLKSDPRLYALASVHVQYPFIMWPKRLISMPMRRRVHGLKSNVASFHYRTCVNSM